VYAGAITGRYAEKEHMPAEVFKTYVEVSFEGKNYKAIADYDAYLKKHYGDYMKLPPKEKQVSNHDYKAWWK
jgi:lipopolysaccharide cholinephosphotransferase